ncbi:MAG: hypothetical protein R6V83_08460 [Candidatus Thorarchaeota archaeon]
MLATGSLLQPKASLESTPNRAWMEGALAGMITRDRQSEESWEWFSFLEDLKGRLELAGIDESVWPGTAGVQGSHYDILGGYTSACGITDDTGLQLPVPTGLKDTILRLLSGIAVSLQDDNVLIPAKKLANFRRLVIIRDPLSNLMGVIA